MNFPAIMRSFAFAVILSLGRPIFIFGSSFIVHLTRTRMDKRAVRFSESV